jgi:hypothetical protein
MTPNTGADNPSLTRLPTTGTKQERSWLWPVAILALFVLLFVGAGWLVHVAWEVREVPMDTESQPAVVGGTLR